MDYKPDSDRARHYGDGIFTTMAVCSGKVKLWPLHRERIIHDCQRLAIPVDIKHIEGMVTEGLSNHSDGIFKLHISAGIGGRGYQRSAGMTPFVSLSHHIIPDVYHDWRRNGITVDVSPVKLGRQPLLAGIKHLNRLEQVLIKQRLTYDDAIVLDAQDNVIEGSASNLFWFADGQWHTPAVSHCGVAGVYRESVLNHLAQAEQPVRIAEYPLSSLLRADEAFLCNAIMEIVPIRRMVHEQTEKSFSMHKTYALHTQLTAVNG